MHRNSARPETVFDKKAHNTDCVDIVQRVFVFSGETAYVSHIKKQASYNKSAKNTANVVPDLPFGRYL
jgi:hypothetical protein